VQGVAINNNKKDFSMANFNLGFNINDYLMRLGRVNKNKRKQAAEQAIHKSRSVIYALGMVLESQRISPVTTTIVRDIDGQKQRITLLEVIRGAEAALNELEAIAHE
jgi:hypothetical protein